MKSSVYLDYPLFLNPFVLLGTLGIYLIWISCSSDNTHPVHSTTTISTSQTNSVLFDLAIDELSSVPIYANYYDSTRVSPYPLMDYSTIKVLNLSDGVYDPAIYPPWKLVIYFSNSALYPPSQAGSQINYTIVSQNIRQTMAKQSAISPIHDIPLQQNTLKNNTQHHIWAAVQLEDDFVDGDTTNNEAYIGALSVDDSGNKKMCLTSNSPLTESLNIQMFLFDLGQGTLQCEQADQIGAVNQPITDLTSYQSFFSQEAIDQCCFLSYWESYPIDDAPVYFYTPDIKAGLGGIQVSSDLTEWAASNGWSINSSFMWDKYLMVGSTYLLRVQIHLPDDSLTAPLHYALSLYPAVFENKADYIPVCGEESCGESINYDQELVVVTPNELLPKCENAVVWDYKLYPQLNGTFSQPEEIHWIQFQVQN